MACKESTFFEVVGYLNFLNEILKQTPKGG